MFEKFPLLQPDDGTHVGTGSDGKTDLQGDPPPKDETVEKPFNEDQIRLLNQIVTNHMKRVETKTTETIKSQVSPIMELLEQMKSGSVAPVEPTDAHKPDPAKLSEEQKAVLKLSKQIEDMQKALQAKDQEAQTANAKAMEERVKSQVLNVLSGLKVEKTDQVYQLIRDSITVEEDGKITMRSVDPQIGYEEDTDLKTGLKRWLDSDGIHFQPPKGTSGSGVTVGKGATAKSNMSMEQIQNLPLKELAKLDLEKIFGTDAYMAALGKEKKY